MKYRTFKSAFIGLVLSVSGVAHAGLIIIHGSGIFTGGPATFANFEVATFAFTTLEVNTLTITDFGSGYINPGFHGPYNSFIDLYDGATWINIFDSGVISVDTNLSVLWAGTLSFSSLNVSGIRIRANSPSPYAYHNVNTTMKYNLAKVPEPSTLAIFALGMIGFASRRFKKRS